MRGTAETLLWVCVMLESVLSSVTLPDITDAKFIEECVNEHNKARSSVDPPASNMLYMTWDEGLAITARAWAKRCVFKHNIYLKEAHRVHPTFPSVGENIWTGHPPSIFNVTLAFKKWVDEKKDYDYGTNTCQNMCGHYTQVVWASSYKVGCAVQLCPKGVEKFTGKEGVIFVCNYATAGNFVGMGPYWSKGEACSGCGDTCDKKLCRSKERDSLRSYNWAPDWDPTAADGKSPAGLSYVTILIVRPVAIFFTFITAYVVHYKYPNVFCYE
ncbi:hypothetical protein Q5P01_003336 [Channa striata]|uniref:SCP domain-containing protein n=1 Tax=Channa striata TaxID=64152 RepID=A0AA88NJD3_CHASR|nr:hypothetical protein Q5P01_003336 [Channa striata]